MQIVSADPTYTFTATKDRALTAVFEEIPVYTVTVTIDPAGGGTVTGAGQYQEGETVTLKATAADGYKFAKWTANGQEVGTGESYTFSAAGDVDIVAVFEEKVSRLPAGYTELEYVYRNSTAGWLSLSRSLGQNARIEIDVWPDAHTGGTPSDMFYAQSNGTSGKYNCFGFKLYSDKITSLCSRNTSSFANVTGSTVTTNATSRRFLAILDCYEGFASIGSDRITVTKEVTDINMSGRLLWNAPAKLYSYKQYQGGVLVSECIPCVDPNGKATMYDIVNNKSLAASYGSVIFDPGPAV